MKAKKSSQSSNKQVLEGYKKVGTEFIPPLLHRIGPWEYISWSRQTLRELIWWDVIADQASARFAAHVADEIAKYFKLRDRFESWWAFISDYSRLDSNEMDALRQHLRQTQVLSKLSASLQAFLTLYPECPISGLFDFPRTIALDAHYLQHLETRLRELEDKRSKIAVLCQAQAVYMGFIQGKLKVAEGLSLANFPEVARYPQTEESMKIGASVCSLVNMIAGRMLPAYSEDRWVQYFWRRSLEMSPLGFEHLETK